MGVDARILIKITEPSSWLSRAQLRQLSAKLTSVIGSEHFFLRPEDDRHALSFTIDDNARYPDEYEEIYGRPFDPNGPAVFSQDGDEIVAKPNEQFIEVHVWSRYYGEDYARGDWKTLSWVMLWCVYNIPNCEVWYGGDSSGICAEQMTPGRMQEMTKYFLTSGNDEYWMNAKHADFKCEFCGCGVVNSGGGQTCGFYHCDSCGSQWVTTGNHTMTRRFGPVNIEGMLVTKYDPYGTDRDLKQAMACFEISNQIQSGKRQMFPFDGTFRQKYPHVTETQPAIGAPAKQIAAAATGTPCPICEEADCDSTSHDGPLDLH
jgi:hypothetical protein